MTEKLDSLTREYIARHGRDCALGAPCKRQYVWMISILTAAVFLLFLPLGHFSLRDNGFFLYFLRRDHCFSYGRYAFEYERQRRNKNFRRRSRRAEK